MSKLTDELTLANALRPHRITVFDGLTTHEERKEKARHGIREKGIAYEKVLGLTLGEWFLKTYGETL